ncbi:SDR family NAD(P)-dependent oxidoreductase [Oenococcus kitaharae]|uniref:Oxidoreductaseshort chain dehydrogenase/reductase family n=1 Tax=Oenococcus kitaharae DSM 17330 TaxID=1045004 RepID=G9WGW1_9LACO|nr:SDR family oxidoreductase [Oenococcus kitaharae]EHN59369.1 oxidoreductaseshort chain dehydrogenase/reductase family [Oenococcus kitaharae DSM 17330]OEY83252.1 3-oxoacyl-ACP reductase [Oenococcus kitaharae]OEY85050.1 3-oxoacyl-ACP reductase [Oenococcus kitaharae]OEY85905.1 3-oxoacyl-ACP reductase [Oenococcus kitaharae]
MTENHYQFENKVVLITGGGSGIGRAITQAFLQNGASVAIVGRRLSALQETLAGYPAEKTLAIAEDISKPESAHEIVEEILEHFHRLDVVVSDAAVFKGGDFDKVSVADWETLRSINVDAFFYLAQAALPALKASKGNFVAISSVSGSFGDWKQAIYNASKHAINGFVRSLALDWGAFGVRINAVAPAFTLSDMTKNAIQNPAQLVPYNNRVALGRVEKPADVAPAVLFLASADAAYITGTILTVDGGTSASTGQPHLA